MRILLRNDGKGNEYVWHDATYENERYYLIENDVRGREVYETHIAAFEGHTKSNYVVCRRCGEFIENTPEKIEEHYKKREAKRDCTNCGYLTFNRGGTPNRTLVKNENGTYRVTETFDTEIFCNSSYYRKRMEEVDHNKQCVFHWCRRDGVRPLNDVFTNYPGAFDTAITVDTLIKKKYKLDGYEGGYFIYDMKSRGTIKACVNSLGIVVCFRVSSNGNKLFFYYSEKYKKMFMTGYYDSHYMTQIPHWFKENKYEEAVAKIKALYEGEN